MSGGWKQGDSNISDSYSRVSSKFGSGMARLNPDYGMSEIVERNTGEPEARVTETRMREVVVKAGCELG